VEETNELIKSDIGDRCFLVLVDEAHDASIKEQMAVVMRCISPLRVSLGLLGSSFFSFDPNLSSEKGLLMRLKG